MAIDFYMSRRGIDLDFVLGDANLLFELLHQLLLVAVDLLDEDDFSGAA